MQEEEGDLCSIDPAPASLLKDPVSLLKDQLGFQLLLLSKLLYDSAE